jgi:hypothetical protein
MNLNPIGQRKVIRSRSIAVVVLVTLLGTVALALIVRRTARANKPSEPVGGSITMEKPGVGTSGTGGQFEVSLTSGGGLTVWGSALRSVPIRVVDGVLYAGSPTQPPVGEGPALQPILQQPLTADELKDLRTQLLEAGLLGDPIDFGLPGVTDSSTTHIVIREGAKTYDHAIYALEFGDEAAKIGITNEQFEQRKKVQKLLAESILNATKVTAPYTGDRLVIMASRIAKEDLDRREPAPAPVVWTGPAVLKGSYVQCLELSVEDSAAAISAMGSASANTVWSTPDGMWQVSGHVLTPNEHPCAPMPL